MFLIYFNFWSRCHPLRCFLLVLVVVHSRIAPPERCEVQTHCFYENGSWVGVLSHPYECHDGIFGLLEKFKVKVHTGEIWNLWNRVLKGPTYSRSHRDSENIYFYLLPIEEYSAKRGLSPIWFISRKMSRQDFFIIAGKGLQSP